MLFWGSARIITADGREIPFSDLSPAFINIRQVKKTNADYREGPVKIQGELHQLATPAQPLEFDKPGIVRIDLKGKNAARLKATLGSDFLQGPEAERRKTMAIKAARGTKARFLTLIEPYEAGPTVKHATATSDHSIRVELADGRVQEITIHNLDGDPSVDVVESKDGKKLRHETTLPGDTGDE